MSRTDYDQLNRDLAALSEGTGDPIAVLANASALLYGRLEDLNWAGFYRMKDGRLILGPFQGKPACVEKACAALPWWKRKHSSWTTCICFPGISPVTAHPIPRSLSPFASPDRSSAFWISTARSSAGSPRKTGTDWKLLSRSWSRFFPPAYEVAG